MTQSPTVGSPNICTNFNHEVVADRPSNVPQDAAWSHAFHTAAETYSGPRLLAWRGYIPWSDARAYYRDEAGNWLDTADDTLWPGTLAETFNTAWKAKFDLRT